MKYFRFLRAKEGHYAIVRAATAKDAERLIYKRCYPYSFIIDREIPLNEVRLSVLGVMSREGTDFAFYSEMSLFATTNPAGLI